MAATGPGINLPPCEAERLVEVAELVTAALSSVSRSEKLALALKKQGYIPKLLELLQVCEELQLTQALQHLSAIMRGILCLGKAALLEVMFSQECIMDVVGCLEYGLPLAQPKWHQQLLSRTTKLKELLPICDLELRQKFHQMYWARHVHAIILPKPSGLGEGSLPSLTSFIICKKEEIFRALEKDQIFWCEVWAQLTAGATAAHQHWELVSFLKEFCAYSFMFRQKREAFLQSLAKLGLLPAPEILLGMDDLQVTSAATDILSYLMDFCPFLVHEFVMQEAKQRKYDTDLIRVVMKQMFCHAAVRGAEQFLEVLQTLLDPGNLLATADVSKMLGFFNYFYTCCLPALTAPLLVDAAKGALHFLRKIIGLKDELYNHYITRGYLLAPLVQALLQNGAASSLLHWAVPEVFEFLRLEDCQSLIAHVVENFYPALESIAYVQTFQGLKRKYQREKQKLHRDISQLILPIMKRRK